MAPRLYGLLALPAAQDEETRAHRLLRMEGERAGIRKNIDDLAYRLQQLNDEILITRASMTAREARAYEHATRQSPHGKHPDPCVGGDQRGLRALPGSSQGESHG